MRLVYRLTLTCLAATLPVACYRYVPAASIETVPLGTNVRARLSGEAELALRDSLGLDLPVLAGTLVDRDASRVLVQVHTGAGAQALGTQALQQRIAVTPQDVLRVDVRQLDRPRTVGFVALIVGAAVVIAAQLLGPRKPGSDDKPPPPPPEQLRPVYP